MSNIYHHSRKKIVEQNGGKSGQRENKERGFSFVHVGGFQEWAEVVRLEDKLLLGLLHLTDFRFWTLSWTMAFLMCLFLRVIVNFGLWSQKENPYCWKGSPSGGCPLWEEAERANWIWARVHTFKAHLYWSISSSKDEPPQSTITFPNRVTTWEPSPQIHEPTWNYSNLITTISKFSLYRKFLYWTKRKSIRYNLSKKS